MATSWHLWPNTLAHRQMLVGGRCDVGCGLCAVGQELGFQWVFEPWPEMIQGVMRLGRPWVVVLCGQAKCRNVPSQGDGSYLGCWRSEWHGMQGTSPKNRGWALYAPMARPSRIGAAKSRRNSNQQPCSTLLFTGLRPLPPSFNRFCRSQPPPMPTTSSLNTFTPPSSSTLLD